MKLRHPWLIQGLGLLGASCIRAWRRTINLRLKSLGEDTHPLDPRKQRCIYAFWHESILATTLFRIRAQGLVSQHADGELMAQVYRHLRIGTIRGSTGRGGVSSLLKMIKACRTHLAIIPDGSRGPRHRVQPGTIFLASRTGLPLVGFAVGYTNVWRANSWDRFAVALPYSAVTCVFTASLKVPMDLDKQGLAEYALIFEKRLMDATEEAQRLATGRKSRLPAVEETQRNPLRLSA